MDAYLQVLKEEMDVHFRRFGEPADCVAPGSENLRQMGAGLFARLAFHYLMIKSAKTPTAVAAIEKESNPKIYASNPFT